MLTVNRLLLLRAAWWAALVLLVVQVVVSPRLLAGPSSAFGVDGLDIEVQWFPLGLFVWLLVGARVIANVRATPPPNNAVVEAGKGVIQGSGVLTMLIVLMVGAMFIASGLARLMAAALS